MELNQLQQYYLYVGMYLGRIVTSQSNVESALGTISLMWSHSNVDSVLWTISLMWSQSNVESV